MKSLVFLLLPLAVFGQDCRSELKTSTHGPAKEVSLSSPVGKQLTISRTIRSKDTTYQFSTYIHTNSLEQSGDGIVIHFADQTSLEDENAIVNVKENGKAAGYIYSSNTTLTREQLMMLGQKTILTVTVGGHDEAIKPKQGEKFKCWAGAMLQ